MVGKKPQFRLLLHRIRDVRASILAVLFMLTIVGFSAPSWRHIAHDITAHPRCPCPTNEAAYNSLLYVKHINVVGDSVPCPKDDISLEFEHYLQPWRSEIVAEAKKEAGPLLPERRFVAERLNADRKCLHRAHMRYLSDHPHVFLWSFLQNSNFSNSFVWSVNFENADLGESNLRKSFFRLCNLSKASLSRSDLTDAILSGTNIEGARLSRTTFQNTRYEVEGVPKVNTMHDTVGLDTLCYLGSPKALVELREAFNKAGMTKQARDVNYSLRTWMRLRAGGFLSKLEWVFLSLPSRYGQAPFRPLSLIALSIVLFFFVYWCAVVRSETVMVFSDAIAPETGKPEARATPLVRLSATNGLPIAVFLSLIFAFRIGWREINIGAWIERLQPNAAEIRTRGWVRTVAGIQSLLSLYLLALCLLSLINGYI